MKKYISDLAQNIFSGLQDGETLSLSLHSEESDFVRFNHSKVRQNTQVHQHELTLDFRLNGRQYKSTSTLTLDLRQDSDYLKSQLKQLRHELPQTDPHPNLPPMENHGVSEAKTENERPPTGETVEQISRVFANADMAGFYCAGPIRRASLNSLGQFHYFENEQFFFDYSIYDGPRAVKGFYSEPKWNEKRFTELAQGHKNTLSLLTKPQIQLKPGSYRAYLSPMAVAEIIEIFNWRAVSRAAFEQGFAPLKKLHSGDKAMSPLFSLIENNGMGLNSHFNSIGEISPAYLPIIENGELKNLLVSASTAVEYSVASNQAESHEHMRSIEVRAGTLTEEQVLKELGTGLYLGNLHYINWSDPQAARITGMTRFACFWVENGEIVGPIQDLRFDDSLYNIFGDSLLALTSERQTFVNTSTYQKRSTGGMRVPGALLGQMNFTL